MDKYSEKLDPINEEVPVIKAYWLCLSKLCSLLLLFVGAWGLVYIIYKVVSAWLYS